MKSIDEIALRVSEVTLELMYDTVDWELSDVNANGDDYNVIHARVMHLAIKQMQTKYEQEQIIYMLDEQLNQVEGGRIQPVTL